MTSLRDLSFALHEYDFAKRAESHGTSSTEVMLHAIRNLPDPELQKLRPFVEKLIQGAVGRTEAALRDLGVDIDMPFPQHARSSYQSPIPRKESFGK